MDLLPFVVFVVCSFCGQDFKSLGRHTWRCKEKLKTAEIAENVPNNSSNLRKSTLPITIDEYTEVSNCSHVKCCCGKLCNGLRGLKMHQRSCRVIKSLTDETFEELEETENIDTGQELASVDFDSMPTIKPGIKLPKSDDQWKTTNAYFAASLPISEIDHSNISVQIAAMNSTIYNYFHDNFGTLEDTITLGLFAKYNDMSKKELKSNLHQLKTSRANPLEIKYVAKLLRSKLKATPVTVSPIDNDIQIQKNFWGFIKANFQQSPVLLVHLTKSLSFLLSAVHIFDLISQNFFVPFGNQGTLHLSGKRPALSSFTKRVTLLILQILGPSPSKAFHSRYLRHVCVIRFIPFYKPIVSLNIEFKRVFFLNYLELFRRNKPWTNPELLEF